MIYSKCFHDKLLLFVNKKEITSEAKYFYLEVLLQLMNGQQNTSIQWLNTVCNWFRCVILENDIQNQIFWKKLFKWVKKNHLRGTFPWTLIASSRMLEQSQLLKYSKYKTGARDWTWTCCPMQIEKQYWHLKFETK